MKTLRYKTSIQCNGCLISVRPFLNAIAEIEAWKVDLDSPDKILSVQSTEDVTDLIRQAVESAGHTLSKMD